MNRLFGTVLFLGLFATSLSRATDATWVNNGNIVEPPTIDATNVINNGSISINTISPFDTSNTRNFTNAGSMTGSVGFRFDNAPRNSSGQLIGQRKLAENFHNKNTGSVRAIDGGFSAPLFSFNSVSYLLVHATNIYNQGSLTVGPAGLLQIIGTNVNIARSSIAVDSIFGVGSFNGTNTFFPDTAVYDNYWGQTNQTMNVSGITTFVGTNLIVSSPNHDVTTSLGFSGTTFVGFDNLNPFNGYTNAAYASEASPTNLYRQAVFVRLSSTNMKAEINFIPSGNPTNLFRTVRVKITQSQSNVVSQSSETNFVYIYDTLALTTNGGTLLNTNFGTARPANYVVARSPSFGFAPGVSGNANLNGVFLYAPSFLSRNSDGKYAGYSAFFDNLASRPPAIPAGDVTNNPGRIEIRADTLDMNKTRIRAQGLLTIQANNLINSSNAVIDSENLSYNLASTNGLLRVQNLVKDEVIRFKGDVKMWSGVWTNGYFDANLTNNVLINYHALIIDAETLDDIQPVSVYDFRAKATNVIFSDTGTIGRSFLVECESFTLDGALTLTDSIQNWTQVLAPSLMRFTNNGFLSVSNEAHFGDEGATPYQSFVNNGTISSSGQIIRGDYVRITGSHDVSSSFNLNSANGEIDGGEIQALSSITISGLSNRLNQVFINSGASLVLKLTNSLRDDGVTSSNVIVMRDGFFMSDKPASGDLLGTDMVSFAPNNAQVNHVWAGRNDGVSNSGYTNNTALGYLSLRPEGGDPLFVFSGAGLNNGLYVDFLDLSQLSDYANQLQIDPNLVIYYAVAAANFTTTNGLSAEEFLDGQFNGRLRWVRSFSGPNSTTNVVINGNQNIIVNLALRTSQTLDSDADGIVNATDVSPFDGVQINSITRNVAPAGYNLSWNAAPNTLYRVEAKTNLASTAWSTLFTTMSTNSVTAPWTVLATNSAPTSVTRYFRVTYAPN